MRRRTRQRDAIRRALELADRPLGPGEVLEAARAETPGLGLATVYRNLRRLESEGAIVRVDVVGEGSRFELAGKAHHAHYHCRACDRLFEMAGCPVSSPEGLLPPGFTVEGHEVVFHGRCAECGP